MSLRRTTNPGRREREAGKRHRRAILYTWRCEDGRTAAVRLKLGLRHRRRWKAQRHLVCGR